MPVRRRPRRPHLAPSTCPTRPSSAAAKRVAADGAVELVTIYPGWYPGRTVHIHLMAHTAAGTATTQLYFPEEITDRVLATEPYRDRPGRDTTNATDTIFATGGEPAVLELRPVGGGYVAAARLHLP